MILNIKNQKLTPADLESGKFSENKFSENDLKVIKLAKAWLSGQKKFTINTSGSTGKPKKIVLTRKTLEYSTKTSMSVLDPHSQFTSALLCISPDYIGGMMVVIRALVYGLKLTVVEPSSRPASFMGGQRFDLVSMVPLQVQSILEDNPGNLSQFRVVLIGGAPLNKKYLPDIGKQDNTKVYQTYGMTETASHIALDDLSKEDRIFCTMGDVRIAQDERNCLRLCGTVTENRWIQTNDVVELVAEDKFRWLGRADFAINSGGFKVHPERVEAHLSSQLRERFIITGLPHPTLGQQVTLVIEGNETGPALNFDGLHPYEQPKKIIFLPKFAVTGSGKIDRLKTKNLIHS